MDNAGSWAIRRMCCSLLMHVASNEWWQVDITTLKWVPHLLRGGNHLVRLITMLFFCSPCFLSFLKKGPNDLVRKKVLWFAQVYSDHSLFNHALYFTIKLWLNKNPWQRYQERYSFLLSKHKNKKTIRGMYCDGKSGNTNHKPCYLLLWVMVTCII